MIIKTSNFYLAAAFLASGIPLIDIDRSDRRHLRFCFEGDELSTIEEDWDNYSLMINARVYAEAVRDVKLKIHQIIGE